MLARMNFAATLSANQKFNLRDLAARARAAGSPEALLAFYLDRLSLADIDRATYGELLAYLYAGGDWTDTQVLAKSAGLVHLLAASSEYQFV